MAEFYKMNPAKWDNGTADLTLEQEAAYLRIVNAINKCDEPCPANMHVLAGLFRCNTQRAKRLLRDLVDAGKVWVEDGKIYNEHAMNDVQDRRGLRVTRQRVGELGGTQKQLNRLKALKDNETGLAIATPREEKRRKKERDTNVSPKKTPASVLTSLLGPELAGNVVEHRQRLRKPLTVKAAELLALQFEQCADPPAGAEMMLANGWQGFKADWFDRQNLKVNGRNGANDKFARIADMATRLDGRAAADSEMDSAADYGPSESLLPARLAGRN